MNDIDDGEIKGINTKNKVLKKILKNWIYLTKISCNIAPKNDAPYWYNETNNTAILCAAANKAGLFSVMEEYTRVGRSKSYLDLRINSKKKRILIEAKFHSHTKIDTINKKLKRALNQIRKEELRSIENGCSYIRYAAVFYTPRILEKTNCNNDITNNIKNIIKSIKKNYNDFAYVFPKSTRWLPYQAKKRKYIFPGVILIFERAK